MNTSVERGGLGGAVAELLKNPAVIEGILTGVSAIAASRRVKNPASAVSGIDIGGMIELLPQIMPLISMFGQTSGGAQSEPASDTEVSSSVIEDGDGEAADTDVSEAMSLVDTESDSVPTANISYVSKKDRRESLLLAIRPYLSESRVAAADAMIQVNRISGLLGI